MKQVAWFQKKKYASQTSVKYLFYFQKDGSSLVHPRCQRHAQKLIKQKSFSLRFKFAKSHTKLCRYYYSWIEPFLYLGFVSSMSQPVSQSPTNQLEQTKRPAGESRHDASFCDAMYFDGIWFSMMKSLFEMSYSSVLDSISRYQRIKNFFLQNFASKI